MSRLFPIWFGVGLCLPAVIVVRSDTNTLYLPSVADTSLFENSPDNNLGGLADLPAGTTAQFGKRGRNLFKFDIAGNIPSNAVITAAALALHVSSEPRTPVNSNFDLHRMLQPWGEGHGSGGPQGAPAQPGEATWDARLNSIASWSKPGAAAPADFASTVSATTLIRSPGAYTFASTSNLVADLQFWLSHPTNNFGWIVISEAEADFGTARRFSSRENTTTNNRPSLLVQYLLPTPSPSLVLPYFTAGLFQFQFAAQTNQVYVVEYQTRLDPSVATNWLTWTNLTAVATNAIISDVNPADPQRFYRVRLP